MEVDEKWVGIAILRDVTERKLQEAELERMALHDALTGLPNRTLLSNRIEHAIRSAQRTGDHMAILLLDLDRFKDVNDTLGHQVGDQLLTEVAAPGAAAAPVRYRRPPGRRRVRDPVGGADRSPDGVPRRRRRGRGAAAPFAIQDLALEVGISIGVALYPSTARPASELLQHADVAMYAAKRDHLGFVVYSAAESDTHSVRQLTLTGELRRAIEDDQLVLEFQPKIDARTGRVRRASRR